MRPCMPFDTACGAQGTQNLPFVLILIEVHDYDRWNRHPPPPIRFDANGDGRIDLLNFLNFFLTRDRKERRRAARVTRALEAMREDALHKQVDKIKKQTIGHVDRCVRVSSVD